MRPAMGIMAVSLGDFRTFVEQPVHVALQKLASRRLEIIMASDPRFDTVTNQDDLASSPSDEDARGRSKWTSCLIGCLGVLAVLIVLAAIAGIWIGRNWRGLFADVGSQAVNQVIDSSELPPQEKVEVKAQVERVAKGFRNGEISSKQAAAIMEKLTKSPLMPSLVVAAVEKTYFDRSGLSNEEKAQGRQSLTRFARGAIDGKIDQKAIDGVMAHVADRRPNGQWQLRSQVSDAELRAALADAKSQADAAGIPAEPEKFDPSDEVKRIIDEALREAK